uniref:Kinectin isoform X2 n=1 Tax=Geotrypetes seraphini TaxID=260995 RepID=A0A6P8RNF5_GEOSA|nr:kinectin isoform X2 [Geotrypetes seraphini]
MEFYESPYFIILVPSVVITLIFLFFWLFMKETSYDEVLAKQKKDQKLPPAKVDKKKTEKRKNKKKDAQNGTLHESDSESAARDFELMDALVTDEEHVVPVPLSTPEAPSSLRDRKKKEKKQPKPAVEEQLTKETGGAKFTGKKVEPVPITKQPSPLSDTAISKKKPGPKKQKNGREDSPISSDTKVESFVLPTKKHEPINLFEMKQESGVGKRKGAIKKQKIENVSGLVDEPLIEATTYIPLMDNTNANSMVEKDLNNTVKNELADVFQKSNVKKLKNETDKENAEVRVKDFLLVMKNMIFTEEEALHIVELLKEKSNAVKDAIHKANKGDSALALRQLQEKEKLLLAAKEEATLTKEQCKQLTQELLAEKQKGSLIEAKVRERISTLEKEQSALQNKMHTNYQDTQQMQLKFKQVREQLENQITHLKQENGILRDAVSSATNQMESKQSSELNKLRQDCARLMNELAEKNSKLAQEELQKKSAEQAVTQLTAQHQEAERRREEIETYLRKMTAQYEDIQAKSLSKENEIKSLHSKLTDTVVSKQQLEQRIMEDQQTRVTEDSLKIQMQELLEQNELMKVEIQNCHKQLTTQASTSVLVEELQKAIAEKGKQIKQTEDSLAKEHAHLTNSEEELKASQRENVSLKAELQKLKALKNEQVATAHVLEQMQRSIGEKDDKIRTLEEQFQNEHLRLSSRVEEYKALQNQNTALQAEIQKLQAQLFEQANKELIECMQRSIEEKEEKIKTVEELLETGLIEVANKEEKLQFLMQENSVLQKEVQNLLSQKLNEVSLNSMVEELQKVIHEKDGKIKSVEEQLQAEYLKTANKEQTVQALLQEIECLNEDVRNIQCEKTLQVSTASLVQELQNQLKGQGEQMKVTEVKLEERVKDNAHKDKELQVLLKENEFLKGTIEVAERQHLEQIQQVSQDLQNFAMEQEVELKIMAAKLDEKEHDIADRDGCIKDLEKQNEILKNNVQELQQQQNHQYIQQVSSAVQNEDLLNVVTEKEMQISTLQIELESTKAAVEQQRNKNNEREQYLQAFEIDERKRLEKLFPQVSVSSSLKHGEWMQEFEKLAQAKLNEIAGSAEMKLMQQRLKEAEEVHTVLQKECEKYKSVLAETEGILQRLQRSVEEEESRWSLKIEESQKELQEMQSSVHSLEQEIMKLRRGNKETENFKREREHLETELEKAELERTTYVSEVRELKELLTELQKKLDDSYSEAVRQNEELNLLKTQLNETLMKLEGEQSERQKVAGDLYQAQQSLDLIQSEIVKAAGDSSVIANSSVSSEMESERKEKVSASLNQTVIQLQQLLQAVNQQLTKGHEHYQTVG